MKRLLFYVAMALCSIVLYFYSLKQNDRQIALIPNLVEALAENETENNVYCKCSNALIAPNRKCLVTNSGVTCASGYNIKCQDFNSNCY